MFITFTWQRRACSSRALCKRFQARSRMWGWRAKRQGPVPPFRRSRRGALGPKAPIGRAGSLPQIEPRALCPATPLPGSSRHSMARARGQRYWIWADGVRPIRARAACLPAPAALRRGPPRADRRPRCAVGNCAQMGCASRCLAAAASSPPARATPAAVSRPRRRAGAKERLAAAPALGGGRVDGILRTWSDPAQHLARAPAPARTHSPRDREGLHERA